MGRAVLVARGPAEELHPPEIVARRNHRALNPAATRVINLRVWLAAVQREKRCVAATCGERSRALMSVPSEFGGQIPATGQPNGQLWQQPVSLSPKRSAERRENERATA